MSHSAPLPKIISNLRSHNKNQGGQNLLFWDFVMIIGIVSSLQNQDSYSEAVLVYCIEMQQDLSIIYNNTLTFFSLWHTDSLQ